MFKLKKIKIERRHVSYQDSTDGYWQLTGTKYASCV